VYRVTRLFPDSFAGAAQLPQVAGQPLDDCVAELARAVTELGFVGANRNPAVHTLGAHYLNADTTAFMQLVSGDLFQRFPSLRLVIPHGGGAVPYHWGRVIGLTVRE